MQIQTSFICLFSLNIFITHCCLNVKLPDISKKIVGKLKKVEKVVEPLGKKIFRGLKLNKKIKLPNQNVLKWKGATVVVRGILAIDPPEIAKKISDELKRRLPTGKSCRIHAPRLLNILASEQGNISAPEANISTVHLGPKAEGALLTDFVPCSERKRGAKSGKNKPSKSKAKQKNVKMVTNHRQKRSESYAAINWLWSDPENIPLIYDSSFPEAQKPNAKAAREMWENYTCVKFYEEAEPAAPNQSYVLLTTGGGYCPTRDTCDRERGHPSSAAKLHCHCSACTTDRLGPNWYSPYKTTVDATTCVNLTGSLSHELGHALGLTHSQSRVDRNKHLTFFADNVADAWKPQFDVDDQKYFNSWGIPFYYDSIMQYFSYAATVNSLMTLCPLDPLMESLMGQRIEPALGDLAIINQMYCQESCFNRSRLSDPFNGYKSMTIGGRTCQNWATQTPHAHSYGYLGDNNFCTNADGWEGGAWCYTNEPTIPYEPCFSACEDLADRKKPYCEGWCYNGGYHNPDTCECICQAHASGKFCQTVDESKRYTHLTCGGRMNLKADGTTYTIMSPNYPKNYSNNEICMWWLTSPLNTTIQVTVNDFEIEVPDQSGCFDYLEIRRSLCATAYRLPETMRYCGNALAPDSTVGPHEVISDDNNLILKFVTDDHENERGFTLTATVLA